SLTVARTAERSSRVALFCCAWIEMVTSGSSRHRPRPRRKIFMVDCLRHRRDRTLRLCSILDGDEAHQGPVPVGPGRTSRIQLSRPRRIGAPYCRTAPSDALWRELGRLDAGKKSVPNW